MSAGVVLRLLAVSVLWASCFPLIKIGLESAPHLLFAAMRAALAGSCLVLIGLLLQRPVPVGTRTWSLVALVAFSATTLGFLGMFHAAEFVSPGIATVIANMQPLIAAGLAYALLRERLTFLGKVGQIAGLAGIAAIAWPGFTLGGAGGYSRGLVYIVLAAGGVAVGNIVIKRLAGQVDAIMAMGFQLLIGAIPLALLSTLTEDLFAINWSSEFIIVLLALSLFGTSLPFWIWFEVLERTDLNRANAFTFLVPVFGLVIGATVFQERLEGGQALGAILVLSGITLVQRGQANVAKLGAG